ncbi:hypothetical protein ACFLIM_46095 [Nonomuraea sp. M3C6]|uniref:Uncharacterized protein n=1 Tax=Nonomuraea marmarensis TaxID=3351344 RepID=A0ABW7AU22_9ACTN
MAVTGSTWLLGCSTETPKGTDDVLPVVTYAVSGLGTAVEEYAAACPGATVGDGLAVRGEEVHQASAVVLS